MTKRKPALSLEFNDGTIEAAIIETGFGPRLLLTLSDDPFTLSPAETVLFLAKLRPIAQKLVQSANPSLYRAMMRP